MIGNLEDDTAPIDTLLSEKEKKIALSMQDDLQMAWSRIAATYEKMTAKRLGQVSFYLPLEPLSKEYDSLDEDIFTTLLRGSDYKEQGVKKGFVYKRQMATPENAHEINDGLWDVWQNYIFKQEHYISSAEWVARAKNFIGDKTIKNTIEKNYSHGWVTGIEKYINDSANPSSLHGSTFIDKAARYIRHNMAVAALASRPAIWLRQIPSVSMYMSEAGLGNFMSAASKVNSSWKVIDGKLHNTVIDFIAEKDPYTLNAGLGYEDMLGYRYIENKAARTKKKVDDFAMSGIRHFDNHMKAIGWLAVYNKNKTLVGEEEAIKMAREYTSLTQPSSEKSTLPGLYRHNELMSMALMFTQQPAKIYNYMVYNVAPNLNPLNKDGSRIAGVLGLASIMTMNAAIWMLTAKKFPEDPEEIAQMLLLGSVSAIPMIGKTIVSQAKGEYYPSGVFTAPVKGVLDMTSYKKWSDASSDPEKMAKQLKSISSGLGIVGGYSAFTNDLIDFYMTGDPIHVILGGAKKE